MRSGLAGPCNFAHVTFTDAGGAGISHPIHMVIVFSSDSDGVGISHSRSIEMGSRGRDHPPLACIGIVGPGSAAQYGQGLEIF